MMSSGESSDNGGEYCICRGPDDHRMMVCCEGGCEEWYHCECVNINVADAKELLDVYICPKCQTEEKFTTWKRMCRYFNVGKHQGFIAPCRKAARVNTDPPSKYCSNECKKLFWEFVKSQVRDDDEPSRGGALSQKEVGFILKQTKDAEEIHALGAKPRLPKKEDNNPGKRSSLL
jgi:COMPASS component SPP1